MRSIKFSLSKKNLSAWDAAVTLTKAYLTNECKADQLLEKLNEKYEGTVAQLANLFSLAPCAMGIALVLH